MQELLQQLINGLSVGSIYALIAVGYTMVYGVLQLINFAHGDVFMVGAMVSLYAATGKLPPSLPWWMHAAILGGLAIGFIVLYLLRRDWRVAAQSLLPLAAIYLILLPSLWLSAKISDNVPESSWVTAGFALVMAVVTCGLLGFVIERLAYRPLRNKPRINSLITAIGISLLLEFGGQHRAVFGPTPQAYPQAMVPGITAELFSVNGVVVSRVDALVLIVTLLLMGVLSYIVLKTKTGLALRAISFRFDTAALMGINIDRIISFTFVLGSMLAAVAGVLYAVKYPKVEPLMGLLPGMKAFVAAVFGGIGNITGAVVGAIILGLVEVLVVGYLPGGSQYRDGVAFVILIVILLVKPSGLFGKHVVEKV
jgi:branched-chain amino acid transport system permease protein